MPVATSPASRSTTHVAAIAPVIAGNCGNAFINPKNPAAYGNRGVALRAKGDLDGALLLLASNAGSYIAGATIVCDGGQMVALRG